MSEAHYLVAVTFASPAKTRCWLVTLSELHRAELERALGWFAKLGHSATYSVAIAEKVSGWGELRLLLREEAGSIVWDAVEGCPLTQPEELPFMLVPVWPFDDERDGFPVSSARFQGVDIEVSAVPSFDEEQGFSIPGRPGLWLPFIMPFSVGLPELRR